MADASIHQPIVVKGWTISKSEGMWRAVNKYGQIGYAAQGLTTVELWAGNKNNKANVRL